MWKMIKGDNITLSAMLLAVGLVVAIITIIMRIGSCSLVPEIEPYYSKKLEVDIISYVALKRSMAQVRAVDAYLPDFSENWSDKPRLNVNWRIKTRAGEVYRGKSIAVLNPPYRDFIFSIQDDLDRELEKTHTERIFINEYRYRIIRETTELHVEFIHPETGNVEARYTQRYDPEARKPEISKFN